MYQSLIFFFFIINVKAQTISDSTEPMIPSQDPLNNTNNFQPSLAVVIGMLSIIFCLTFILLLYAKFCHQASSFQSTRHHIDQDEVIRSTSLFPGVDKTVIESLPFFRFSCLKGSRDGLECAVCLARFEDIEILRLLPKCKHAFHIDCIDLWLEKNSTCPLCRHVVSSDDMSQLPYSNSLRFLWDEHEPESSSLELYVHREENRHGSSSRFSIGSSFRKIDNNKDIKEEELPIQQNMDSQEQPLDKFNHTIVFPKNRWSNVSSSDLMFLNSEMLNDVSSARFLATSDSHENHWSESKVLNSRDKRCKSEIIVHPRSYMNNNRDSFSVGNYNVEEGQKRRLWLPIARKTVEWFANREEIRHPNSQGLNQTSNV